MLTAQRDVIAVDLPGFGSSPTLSGEVTIAELTDAVESFIAEHDLGDIDVVGSSMGARMVMEMARRGHHGTVVALDPGGFWTDRQVKVFGTTVSASIWLVRRLGRCCPCWLTVASGERRYYCSSPPSRGASRRTWSCRSFAASRRLRALMLR